ncbi:PilN domain-containing protein [bacterium]|nr:PilN domain-containing protein [bacterium]
MASGVNLMDQLADDFQPSNSDSESVVRDFDNSSDDQGGGGRFSVGSGLDKREQARFALTLVLAAAAYFGPQYYQSTLMEKLQMKQQELQAIQAKVSEEQQKKTVLASIREEMLEFDKRMDELKRKIAKVNNLNDNRNLLVRGIDFLVTEMPQEIWLSKIDAKRGSGGSISVEGYAKDLQTVSRFMKKLESAVFFPTWLLEETSHEDKGSEAGAATSKEISIPRDVKKFNIRAKLEEPVSS